MKLTNTRYEKPLAVARPDDPAAQTLVRFGEWPSFERAFGAENMPMVYAGADNAVRRGAPTMGLAIRTYGADNMTAMVMRLLGAALVRMGEEGTMDDREIQYTAESVCMVGAARLLNVASVVSFFMELTLGAFEIYGKLSARKIMEAFAKYARKRREEEIKLIDDERARRELLEAEEHARTAISWEAFAAQQGIKDKSLNAWLMRTLAEEREAEEGGVAS